MTLLFINFSLIQFVVILIPAYILIKHFRGRKEPLALVVMSVLSILCWLLIGVVLYLLDIDMQSTALLVNMLIFMPIILSVLILLIKLGLFVKHKFLNKNEL
ncbi:MAG: hypothetical protein LBN74_04430 [Prevotella sp.]|jgi:biotin transporter BioY|nr:hypothetical protein [Prevotella sp.]